jgi:hypothetical protein
VKEAVYRADPKTGKLDKITAFTITGSQKS